MAVISDEEKDTVKDVLFDMIEPNESKIIKSRHIECEIPNNRLGNVLSELSDSNDGDFSVELWSGKNIKVWKVTRK